VLLKHNGKVLSPVVAQQHKQQTDKACLQILIFQSCFYFILCYFKNSESVIILKLNVFFCMGVWRRIWKLHDQAFIACWNNQRSKSLTSQGERNLFCF